MGFLINPYNFAAAGSGGWVELGRTTLGSASDNINVSSLTDKRYYMVLGDFKASGGIAADLRLNTDTGNNYAYRVSDNGGADVTDTNTSVIHGQLGVSTPEFIVGYLSNKSDKEKLYIGHLVNQNTAGAGTAPQRVEITGKHAQTTNPITSVDYVDRQAGQFASGSEVVVLGWNPADTHTNNFWTELASVDVSGGLIDTNVFTAKKYLWIQGYCITGTVSGGFQGMFVGNGTVDKTTSYAIRYRVNGGSDGTAVNQSVNGPFALAGQGGASSNEISFFNIFIINNASNEKLFIGHNTFGSKTGGAGVANNRTECVAKWTNTSNQINRISLEYVGTGSLTAGTLKVWGSD